MISFTPSDEQQLIIDTVRRFASERLRPAGTAADEARSLPADLITRGWDLGLLPSAIPERFSGFGEQHSAVTGVLAAEELAYGDLAAAMTILTPNLFALPILHAGSEAQQERWLPTITEGGFAAYTAALIEPRWDFDPANLSTTATLSPDGEGYILQGRKAYVPLAADAPAMLVYAREGDRTQAFVVERGVAGLVVHDREQHMGLRALPTYEVTFEEVLVPAEAKLGGAVGCNLDLLLNYSRVGLGALAIGVARAAYEYALAYAKQREAFGRPIAQYQAVAFMLSEMIIEIEAARGLVWEAAWQLDRGQNATRAASLAKQYADEAVLFVTDRAVQTLGGHGYIREYPVERWLREGRGFATFLGMAMV
ncbi:MAG: acyl-CoA dehydrogenase family protein [Roseiflexaceae bacterium]